MQTDGTAADAAGRRRDVGVGMDGWRDRWKGGGGRGGNQRHRQATCW